MLQAQAMLQAPDPYITQCVQFGSDRGTGFCVLKDDTDNWKTIPEAYPRAPPRKIKSHLLLKKKEMDEAGGQTTTQLL